METWIEFGSLVGLTEDGEAESCFHHLNVRKMKYAGQKVKIYYFIYALFITVYCMPLGYVTK